MSTLYVSAHDFTIYDNINPHARTGGVSLEMLKAIHVDGVLLGHSELGETLQTTKTKLDFCYVFDNKYSYFKTITLLIGESWEEHESLSQEKVAVLMASKLTNLLHGLESSFVSKIIIGYEPKWGSRNSGNDNVDPPSPSQISACIKEMQNVVQQMYPNVRTKFIYGGRSTPERTKEILRDENISGLILGSACNSVSKTQDIIEAARSIIGEREMIMHLNFKAYELGDTYKSYMQYLGNPDNNYTVIISPSYLDLDAVVREKV